MNSTDFASAATHFVEAFGSTAHSAIDAWRAGGERLGDFAGARWNHAFREASPKLSPETRRNATHAKKVIGGYYQRGVALSTSGAEVAVDTVVQVTTAAIARAEAFRQARSGTAA
ncbi:MAG TPA: hypothetical protein VLJ58_22950 [Ramlibacter sp.]|nr:hypothetical protein [Ramlibacter sp.]